MGVLERRRKKKHVESAQVQGRLFVVGEMRHQGRERDEMKVTSGVSFSSLTSHEWLMKRAALPRIVASTTKFSSILNM